MEKLIKKVVYSDAFFQDIKGIYLYGLETFGITVAEVFQQQILHLTAGLAFQYYLHPECKPLITKTKIYRNIILGKYLIIYRIKSNKVEVLRAIHGSRNPTFIKQARKTPL